MAFDMFTYHTNIRYLKNTFINELFGLYIFIIYFKPNKQLFRFQLVIHWGVLRYEICVID